MFCIGCGQELDDTAKFCSKCGTKQKQAEKVNAEEQKDSIEKDVSIEKSEIPKTLPITSPNITDDVIEEKPRINNFWNSLSSTARNISEALECKPTLNYGNTTYSDDLFEKMKALIAEKLEVDESKITMGAYFRQDLGADSLDTYELVYALEENMGISIPDNMAMELETVQDAYNYIKSKMR